MADSSTRAPDLTTKREILRCFAHRDSPRVIAAAIVVAGFARSVSGPFGWADLMAIGWTVALVGPVEWLVHRFLLHAAEESRIAVFLHTGDGHRAHHVDPSALRHLLLTPGDASRFAVAMAVVAGITMLGLSAIASSLAGVDGGTGAAATAVFASLVALAHYEWTHLLVHSAYRPSSRFYRRLARHHRLHHHRNERYWLGVTSTMGDRVMGTLPTSRSAVPLSGTARSLRDRGHVVSNDS